MFEYLIVTNSTADVRILNYYGNDGWELVHLDKRDKWEVKMTFKRKTKVKSKNASLPDDHDGW